MRVNIQGKDGFKVVNLNRRVAIRERCLNCTGWHPQEVTGCSFDDCPLHSFRSSTGKQDPRARSKAIKAYCLWCMAGRITGVTKCTSPTCPLFAFRKTKIDKFIDIDFKTENDDIGQENEINHNRDIPRHA